MQRRKGRNIDFGRLEGQLAPALVVVLVDHDEQGANRQNNVGKNQKMRLSRHAAPTPPFATTGRAHYLNLARPVL